MTATHLCTRFPVARKWHVCWECTRPIPAGTRYRVDHLAYDCRAYSLKAHPDCAEAGMAVAEEWGTDGEGRGPLHREISESGEPLLNFDLPEPVRSRLVEAFGLAELRIETYRAEQLARIRAARAAQA